MSTHENPAPDDLDEMERLADELREVCDQIDAIAASITEQQVQQALARVMASIKNKRA